MSSKTLLSGFSLLELMIVLAIISILALMAMPSYQRYTQKARFAEIMHLTEPIKLSVALALQQGIPLTELNNGQHNIPDITPSTTNLQSIAVKQGIILATATAKLHHITYQLTPHTEGTKWEISGSCLTQGLCRA